LSHRASLGELKQRTDGIIVLRWGKASVQGLKENGPGGELAIGVHPLKPCKSTTFHIK